MDDAVDLSGAHAGVDLLCHQVENGDVDFAALADALDLFGSFDHRAFGHGVALAAKVVDLLIEIHMAMFIGRKLMWQQKKLMIFVWLKVLL